MFRPEPVPATSTVPRATGSARSWQLADVIDFEFLLEQDRERPLAALEARDHLIARQLASRVERDAMPYTDVATTPVEDSEFEEMQMYTATPAARFAVEKLRRRKAAQPATVP